jgi:hypothetical protein
MDDTSDLGGYCLGPFLACSPVDSCHLDLHLMWNVRCEVNTLSAQAQALVEERSCDVGGPRVTARLKDGSLRLLQGYSPQPDSPMDR